MFGIPVDEIQAEVTAREPFRQRVRDRHAAVLPACAADRDDQLVLALLDVPRYQKGDQIHKLVHELPRFREGHDIVPHRLVVPGEPLDNGVVRLCSEFEGVNGIPVAGSTSANKRLYMFLRWMVRKGSPVDFGIWNRVSPTQLLVPVDTHVYTVARSLGLTSRRSADLKTSIEITGKMIEIWPEDPARGDFALYGSQVM